ncbi:FecR family protein [Sphingobacterium paucimobilis]|uniref:Uncharacterized protein n=1 Tax=Sphingobacterium paucimobilis HER1398 TaxID=1346330 RepID=U2HRQ5_9SPHI|nr:FecR family protein [Sphingobacterium paucimobilis]ERJ58162.1 hypothetical protein M472_05230 [Sphingobacterium paucimobilis HER1398]
MKKIESLDTMVRDFLDGRLSSKKRARFLQFIKENPDGDKLSEIHSSLFDQIQQLSEDDLLQLQYLLKQEDFGVVRPLWKKLIPYAAAMLCIGAFWFFNQDLTNVTELATISKTSQVERTVVLADGSEVILKDDALISAMSFTADERSVTLIGSGYFKVKSDSKPFFVKTEEGFVTRVLGTEFEVSAGQNMFSVAVDKGRVFVSKDHQEIAVLQKGDYVKVTDGNTELHATLAPSLNFENKSLREIVESLNQSYDAHIVLAPNVNTDIKSKVSFDSKLSVLEAVQLLCEINNLDFAFEHDQIVLKK